MIADAAWSFAEVHWLPVQGTRPMDIPKTSEHSSSAQDSGSGFGLSVENGALFSFLTVQRHNNRCFKSTLLCQCYHCWLQLNTNLHTGPLLNISDG